MVIATAMAPGSKTWGAAFRLANFDFLLPTGIPVEIASNNLPRGVNSNLPPKAHLVRTRRWVDAPSRNPKTLTAASWGPRFSRGSDQAPACLRARLGFAARINSHERYCPSASEASGGTSQAANWRARYLGKAAAAIMAALSVESARRGK